MRQRTRRGVFLASVLMLLTVLALSCTTGVEPSPQPGTLRVTLTSDPADTSVIILSDTSQYYPSDRMDIITSQGRAYRGENFAQLYVDQTEQRILSDTNNIIYRENNQYLTYTIFNSYVPPGTYDRLELNLAGTQLIIHVPRIYEIDVLLPPGESPTMSFPINAEVKEGQVTQIDLQIKPFQSLGRYLDYYVFDRQVEVLRVTNP